MSAQYTELAFESYVEEILHERSGWGSIPGDRLDVEKALFPEEILGFIRETQPKLWEVMTELHGERLGEMLIGALERELDLKGTLHVLREGFRFYGRTFKVAWFKPAHGLNDEILRLYTANRLTVTRQVRFQPNGGGTVDLLLALNGLPVATVELKNPVTGQTWHDAVTQYRERRPAGSPLFRFKRRAVAFFAADPDEVHVATELRGAATRFLPFNRGSHPGEIRCGAGNPQHPSGYRTGYFWEEVLQRDRFLEILTSFMYVEKKEEEVDDGNGGVRTAVTETLIFPRYHQLDVVSRLIDAARRDGAGRNYLIQHSAGSGKTNSISWLAHRLSSLHDKADAKVFNCVLVITDRQVLDRQLQDAVFQIEHVTGVVKTIDEDSRQLAEALIDGTPIVVTTLQKFPYVLRGLLRHAGAESPERASETEKGRAREWEEAIATRRYAVIVDEAHSSQTGESARELKEILGAAALAADEEEEAMDWEERLNAIMLSRGRQPNLSFFAFTATPKAKTIEIFGRPGPNGKPEAFHLYSMRQAIEEGFILDVLTQYTTYKRYFNLLATAENDPTVPKKEAIKELTKFAALHPFSVEQTTEIIVEHFRRSIQRQIGGKAKAMVVASSRLHAVRYKLAFDRYLDRRGYDDIHPLVAFSGTVVDDDGKEYTEPGMNIDIRTGRKIGEKLLPKRFASDDYQILLVANKYQTGFDQPLLLAMYVDKRLDGVQAVQTLSRLNRTAPGKEAPFVLDFRNEAEDIYRAFKPYYDRTEILQVTDPGQLEDLKHALDEMRIYDRSEIEAFARVFYKPRGEQAPSDHALMNRYTDPARDRFRSLKDEDRETFREKLTAFVRLYAFVAQIIPWTDSEHERLYTFGRFLLKRIGESRRPETFTPGDDVALAARRTQVTFEGAISVREGEHQYVAGPSEVGTRKAEDEKVRLSEIIVALNERFGTEFNEEDRLFFDQITERAAHNEQVVETARANTFDRFELGIRNLIERIMVDRMSENEKIVERYMADQEFREVAFRILARQIFEEIMRRGQNRA